MSSDLCAMATLGAVLLSSSSALAEPAEVPTTQPLRWFVSDGAVNCPSAIDFRRRLRERMGLDPFESPGAPEFEVRLRREHGNYFAEFRKPSEDAISARTIGGDATTCNALVDALVLSFSLLLEPIPDVAAPSQPKADAATSAAVISPCPPAPKTPCPKPTCPACAPPARSANAWLAAGPILAWNELPDFAAGAMLSAGLELRAPWQVTIGASYLGMERVQRYGARFAFSITEAWLGLGIDYPLHQRLHWHTQLAQTAGFVHGFPENQVPFEPGDTTCFGVRLATGVAWRLLGPLGLGAGLSGELREKRIDFRLLGDSRPVWLQPRHSARAELHVIWELE